MKPLKYPNQCEIFSWLYIKDNLIPVDLIIGFGHFDLRIPLKCLEIHKKYNAPILFTGGRGSGTADLKEPEAIVFKKELLKNFPSMDQSFLIIESSSTNTSENIKFGIKEIEKKFNKNFLNKISTIALVSSPYRQRRVFLTCLKNMNNKIFVNLPPETSFNEEVSLFNSKNFNLCSLMQDEIERINNYSKKGWIENTDIPISILNSKSYYCKNCKNIL